LDIDASIQSGLKSVELRHYPNINRTLGAVISSRLATLHELDTVLSVEDMYDLLEIVVVDAVNDALVRLASKED